MALENTFRRDTRAVSRLRPQPPKDQLSNGFYICVSDHCRSMFHKDNKD